MRKWIFILLSFSTPAFLHAGGNLSLTSPQFSSGSSTNTVVQDSSLTLIKEWSFGGQAAPAGRYHTGFAMDETRNQALLFGGQNELGSTFGDTWVWDLSGGWVQRTPSGPPASRYGHGLVWIGDKFLLFGGSANNQTWAYDIAADTWTYIPVSQSPDSRTLFGMAYDPDQNVAVVFGGVSDNATWIYDVAASSWSVFNLSPAPSARTGTQMVYDKTQRRILLFGGKDWNSSALLDDTWSLDVGNKIWTQKNPTAKPEARSEGALAYDVFNGRVFLYGGSVSAGLAGDLWFYDFGADRWSQHYEFDPNQPAGRFGHGLIYHTQDQKAMIFGGKQDVAVRSVWRYVFRSTGIWSSAALDVWAGFSNVTPNTWDSLTTTFNSKPSYTDVLLQLASSSDGNTYDSFRGPDGSTQTFYASSPTPQTVWTGHSDKRFIKLKAAFNSNDPPARAKVAEFNIAYNRAPFSPVLKSPADNARINDSTPLLAWNLTSDPDGIFTDSPLLYQVQVDTDPVFSSADISEENIPAGSSEVSFTTGTLLPGDCGIGGPGPRIRRDCMAYGPAHSAF
ncbi:MAG: hypothetical protein HY400_00520 [Elusimicrobia bacterium]|nr:hypothetical protein [Elusimicrobiota bacterium]